MTNGRESARRCFAVWEVQADCAASTPIEMWEHPANVAFLIDTISCDTAGTEKQLLEAVRRLDRRLFAPQIICLHSSPWLEDHEVPCPVTVLGYKGFVKRNFPKVVYKLRRILLETPVHIMQTFFVDSVFVAYFATLGMGCSCKMVSSRRDIGLGANVPSYHRLFRYVLPIVNRRFNSIVSNCEEVKRWVVRCEGLRPERIRVIPNGISLPSTNAEIPELFARHPAPLWIGLVANLKPVKRIDVFLYALQIVAERRPDLSFQAVVVGEGPEHDVLIHLARRGKIADRVHFAGAVPNVGPFLQHLDIGVLCSDREGLSNAILEYMAHALPVVVTDVGGNSELVDSTTGFRIPAGDAAALADALILLADEPSLRVRLGNAGREKIRTRYSWERSMFELETHYLQLLAAKGVVQ